MKNGQNSIVIRVNNSFKLGATWNWGGIRRQIKIEVANKVRITRHHIEAIPDFHKKKAETLCNVKLQNYSDKVKKLKVIHILSYGNKIIQNEVRNILLDPYSKKEIVLKDNITKAKF